MTQLEIAEIVGRRTDQVPGLIDAVFSECIREIKKQLLKGEPVHLIGFGTIFPTWNEDLLDINIDKTFAEKINQITTLHLEEE